MRTSPVTVPALVILLAVSGCASEAPEEPQEGGAETAPSAEKEDEAVERVFGTGEQITVDLTLYATEDGGRSTPFFSGYRPTAEFDHLDQSVSCSVQLPAGLDQFAPGETHMVGLECDEEVTVHVGEPGLVLVESGKENGGGEVVFTET